MLQGLFKKALLFILHGKTKKLGLLMGLNGQPRNIYMVSVFQPEGIRIIDFE